MRVYREVAAVSACGLGLTIAVTIANGLAPLLPIAATASLFAFLLGHSIAGIELSKRNPQHTEQHVHEDQEDDQIN